MNKTIKGPDPPMSLNACAKSPKSVLVVFYNFEPSECYQKFILIYFEAISFFINSLRSILVWKNKFWMKFVEETFLGWFQTSKFANYGVFALCKILKRDRP